jgi:hypothetical protein
MAHLRVGLQALEHPEAVLAGKLYVEQDHVGSLGAGGGQRLLAVDGLGDVVAAALELGAQERPGDGRVVRYQDQRVGGAVGDRQIIA